MARYGGRSAGPRQSCCHAHLKELLEAGFVGEVMAVHVSLLRDGVLRRPSHRTWQRDAKLGANTLTIANGHTVDAMRFVTGDFSRLSAVVATQQSNGSTLAPTRCSTIISAPSSTKNAEKARDPEMQQLGQ